MQDAFAYSYITTDGEYLAHAGTDPAALFAGTCAVGAYIDLKTQTIGVSNLGDSRAVVGVFGEKEIRTIPMSEDHTAADDDERKRVEDAHPKDPTCVVQMSEDDDDWRVKQICAFTRSIGDCQMKDKTASTLYNTYTKRKVMPRPGVKAKGEAHKTKPYIVNTPDYSEHKNMKDGFLIVGCDGVWDEMSSEEAVNICAKLILDNAKDAKADIAELFINEVLKKAVVRCQESYEEEENMTLAELKARPQGKKDFAHRSCLHDDITVLIYHFMSDGSDAGKHTSSPPQANATCYAATCSLLLARFENMLFSDLLVHITRYCSVLQKTVELCTCTHCFLITQRAFLSADCLCLQAWKSTPRWLRPRPSSLRRSCSRWRVKSSTRLTSTAAGQSRRTSSRCSRGSRASRSRVRRW